MVGAKKGEEEMVKEMSERLFRGSLHENELIENWRLVRQNQEESRESRV